MGGDNTRFTFDPVLDYAGVLKQQGRVDLDADWNELVEIADRRWRAETVDVLGRCAVSKETPDAFKIMASGGTFTIGAGRLYVHGLLAENHGRAPRDVLDVVLRERRSIQPVAYEHQPYLPHPAPLPKTGRHLAYLVVFRREVTYVESPDLLDKALGGVDTTTRLQTAWQVRLLADVKADRCGQRILEWETLIAPSPARLTTSAVAPPASDDPCIISPAGGYRGLENRLYRVEIHTAGPLGVAKFKWSRDNGSIVSAVRAISTDGSRLTVHRIGRDPVLRFRVGDWIEVLDDGTELGGVAGHMAKVVDVDEADQALTIAPAIPPAFAFDPTHPERHTRARRWDQSQKVDASGLLDVTPGPVEIEDGIRVTFSIDPPGGSFRVGDYWAFAARTADGSVEPLEAAPPRGVHRHYCRLALLDTSAGAVRVFEDCRPLTPATAGAEPGLHVTAVRVGTEPLRNDTTIPWTALRSGLQIVCDGDVAAESVARKPVCFVSVHVPYPISSADRALWSLTATAATAAAAPIVGFQPLVLAAHVTAAGNVVGWKPASAVVGWLPKLLDLVANRPASGDQPAGRVLARLTVKGNFIWAHGDPKLHLDGQAFGQPGGQRTDVLLPSGDGRRGGDFEMWFWLTSAKASGPIFDPAAFPGRILDEIEGVGPVYVGRLTAAGITHPADVASTEPARLVEILGISPTRAQTLINNARRLLKDQ